VKHAVKGTLLIEFGLLTASVCAQSALDIHVTNQQGRALPDAVLTLKRGAIEKHGVTGLDGGFRFLGLPAGEYELLAAADGYFPAEAEIAMRPRQPLNVHVEMVPRQTVSQSVEVRSADIRFGEVSTSRLLTHSELSALPDTVKRDIPTLSLYTFPGATLSHDNFVHVRGNEVSLQEFINGVSFLENPQQQFSVGLTPDSFETINMVSGSFAAEYGNRFGGILDMTTRSGFDVTGHGSLAAGAGSLDTTTPLPSTAARQASWATTSRRADSHLAGT